jgi:hypothetical protein
MVSLSVKRSPQYGQETVDHWTYRKAVIPLAGRTLDSRRHDSRSRAAVESLPNMSTVVASAAFMLHDASLAAAEMLGPRVSRQDSPQLLLVISVGATVRGLLLAYHIAWPALMEKLSANKHVGHPLHETFLSRVIAMISLQPGVTV